MLPISEIKMNIFSKSRNVSWSRSPAKSNQL